MRDQTSDPRTRKSGALFMTDLKRAIALGVAGAAGAFSLGCLGVAVTAGENVLVRATYAEMVIWNYLIPAAVTAGLAVFLFFVAYRPAEQE